MPANSDTTFWTDLGYTARRNYRSLQDYRNWISQMKDIPRYFHEQMDEMRAGLKRGFTPPRVTLEGRDALADRGHRCDTGGEPFLYAVQGHAGHLGGRSEDAARPRRSVRFSDTVQPAYRELLTFFRNEYVPGTRTTLAAYDLPDGKAYYRSRILNFTTLDEDPAAIHAFGEAEVARLHEQMLGAMKETRIQRRFSRVPRVSAQAIRSSRPRRPRNC